MRWFFGLPAIAFVLSFAATEGRTQEIGPLYVASYIEVAPAFEVTAETIFKQLAEATRKESGVINFETAQRISPTSHFVIFGAWKDRPAYDAHVTAEHTKAALAALDAQLIAPIDNHLVKRITSGDLQIPPAGAVYAVTHLAVLPDKISDFSAALLTYAAATRRAAGNLRYFPAQDISRPNHFSVVEMWMDQAAEDMHEAAASSKEFRAIWAPITGPHFDRRWYKSL